ncbi:MAG: Unknown protein [uncultured Sulfurovum sp.]|uniref:Transporter n=1 Tax=uncultured Sulfurovum sp. TaxID=269237 RepID=A0A6S6TSP7_9BACT|nr:MAG: Unknown protein [uncultured Sulfurovum sp.]
MFKYISKTLLTGFITLLPLVLTLYLLYWLGVSSEEFMGKVFRYILPDGMYFPGLGMVSGIVIVFMVGLLMKAYLVRKLFSVMEEILYRLPLIKSIYRAFRDLFDFFSPNKEGIGQAVGVTINGVELVGFLTQENPKRLPPSFRDPERVLVYLPMSYMVGGYTILVKKEDVRKLDMSGDEAMRFVLTAGIAGK